MTGVFLSAGLPISHRGGETLIVSAILSPFDPLAAAVMAISGQEWGACKISSGKQRETLTNLLELNPETHFNPEEFCIEETL